MSSSNNFMSIINEYDFVESNAYVSELKQCCKEVWANISPQCRENDKVKQETAAVSYCC